MLTKLEKQVLKFCIKHNPKAENHSEDILKSVSCSLHELYLCCKNLSKNGYINDLTIFINGDFIVELTYKGTHYNEFSWLEIKQFILRSILVPIIVSITTTGLLWLINKIL